MGGTDQPAALINPQFHDDATTIAYRVFPAHRGQGIAPRAVRPVQRIDSRVRTDADRGLDTTIVSARQRP
jgi:hypothetical protein